MDLRQQAKNVANQGRFGDSMLLHVNPVEMKGLASAMPLTVNPETGQPEAFLPFLAPILGSVLGKALLPTLLPNLLGGKALLASAIGSGLAQTAATGDVKKGLLAGLTGFGVGKFLEGVGGAASQISGEKLAEGALQQAGVPLTTDAAQKAITDAGARNLASSASIATPGASPTLGETLSQTINPDIAPATNLNVMRSVQELAPSFDAKSLDFTQMAQDLPNLQIGAEATLQTLSDPSVYIPAGIGMGTTGQMISQEEFERYLAGAPEREKERIRQLMAMYPEAIPMQEGGLLDDPLIREAGRALSLDEINKRTRRQMSPEEKAQYERAFRLYGMNTESGRESRPDGGGGGGGNQGNGQFSGGANAPKLRYANPIPQGFMGGFAPEFSYFGNVNPSATDLQTGASQAGLSGQGRFAPQTGSGLQLANRDLSANFYADAFANAIPDLTSEQRQQARNYAFDVANTGDTSQMPSFLDDKDFLKGFEAGNEVRSQVQANPNQFGIATPGQFSPTQTAGYRQFYGSSAIGVPQVIDPFSPFQGFSVSPFTPSALPPMSPSTPPDSGTDTPRDQGDETSGDTPPDEDTLPDLTRDQFDLMLQGQEDYADIRRRFENILGVPEAPREDTPIADAPIEDTPVADVPDYAQQLADQAQLIQQLQEQIASNQAAISGIPSVDTSGFLTQEDLSSAIAGIPSFDPSALQSDISGLQTGLAGLQGQFQGFTPFDPTAIQNQLAALQEAQTGFAQDLGGLEGQFQGFTPFDPSNIASQISDLQTGLAGLQGQFQGFTPSPTTISFDDIQGAPDFSQFATQADLSNIPQFDPTSLQDQIAALQQAQTGFAQDLGGLEGQFQGFTPSPTTINFSDIQGLPDFSQFATQQDLSSAISGVPQFDPSTLDLSGFATTEDLSSAISGIPQFDPSNILSQLSNLQAGQTGFAQDLGNLQGQFEGFTPSPTTINFSDIQGVPDFSNFATQEDLSTAISGVPQFDPSTLGLPDFSQFATQADLSNIPQFDPSNILSQLSNLQTGQTGLAQDVGNLQGQFQGFTPFDPSTLNLPDFSQFATQQDLSNISQFDPSGILSQLGNLQQAQTGFAQDLGGLQGQFEGFTSTPTTINFDDIQGVPDFSQFATTDQLFDPSTLDFSNFATTDQLSDFATTDQLFDPTSIQAQIDALQGLLDQQTGTSQAETYGTTGTPGPQTTTSSKSAPAIGRSDGGKLKAVPEDNKGLSKLPEDVRNKMGFMAPGGDTKFPDLTGDGKVTQADILKGRGVDLKQEGGITQAMLDDPLTNQVAQFILGNETNDEVVSAFIDKYGSNAFREIRRAVLKTLAPNAQTEGMIKGSLAGGMEDDIFGVIGDPNKNGQRVAVSQDEFIVPADVVSMLGDGSSDSGANKLEMMMDRIRTEKTNTTKQARPINDKRVLPA